MLLVEVTKNFHLLKYNLTGWLHLKPMFKLPVMKFIEKKLLYSVNLRSVKTKTNI